MQSSGGSPLVLFPNPPVPLSFLLVTVPRAPITIAITITIMFYSFFIFLQGPGIYLSLRFFFFQFYYVVRRDSKVYNSASTLFLLLFNIIKFIRLAKICLYLKILENFVRLILQDRFWVVHLLFVHMVKFQFLAQFPGDYLFYLVVSIFFFFFSFSVLICWLRLLYD